MKQILIHLALVLSFFVNAQNPADIDLTLGSNYAGFTSVDKIIAQPNGKTLIGGAYYGRNGRVARFNADGSVDTSFQINSFTQYNSGINSIITIGDIVLQPDGKILVGGLFSLFNGEGGQSANSLVRLNSDGTKDMSFMPPVFPGGAANTSSIALQSDGKIIIGGVFRVQVNGHYQYHACRLNQDGSIDNTFDFGIIGGPPQGSSSVHTVALQADGKVLIGGSFTQFNNQNHGLLIRLNSDGTTDTTFDIGTGGPGGWVLAKIIIQPDNKILLTGGFTSWNGQQTPHLIRLNANGSLDNNFNNEFSTTNIDSNVPQGITLQPDGKIIAVGGFELYGQNNIWRLNSDGSFDDSLINDTEVSTSKTVLVLPDSKIMIGGYFLQCSGTMRDCFARLNANGSIDTSFLSQGLNDEVSAIAMQEDGKTLLGGSFTTYDTVPQNRIMRISNDGMKDISFNIGSGFNNPVKTIVVQTNGKILVGGNFTLYNQQPAKHIIRLNQDGTKDASFNIGLGFNENVSAIALQPDGKLLVGGYFTQYNGQPQNYFIRLNSDGTKDTTYNVENIFDARITALLLQQDGKVVVGGNFTTFGGSAQRCLARLNEDGTKDIFFTPPQTEEFLWPYTTKDAILDFATQPDGKIYVITSMLPRRLNSDGTIDSTFNAGYYYSKSIAIQDDGKILLGGTFDYLFGGFRKGLVRLNSDGTTDANFDISLEGDMQSGGFFDYLIGNDYGCKEIIIQPDNKIWLAGNFFFYRGAQSFAAVRLIGDSFLATVSYNDAEINEITLYPNPVQNTLNLKSKNSIQIVALNVYDVMGQLVLKSLKSESIDVSILTQGVYFLKIQTINGNVNKKFLKK